MFSKSGIFVARFKNFKKDEKGAAAVQMALLFGAGAVVFSLILAPFLDSTSRRYAEQRSPGIDQITTASTSTVKQYTIRKSVLDNLEVTDR